MFSGCQNQDFSHELQTIAQASKSWCLKSLTILVKSKTKFFFRLFCETGFFLYFHLKFCEGNWEIGAQPIRNDPLAHAKRFTAVFFPSYLVVSGGSQLTLKLHNILQQSGPPTLLKEKKMRKEM